jgi:hypothetical protein
MAQAPSRSTNPSGIAGFAAAWRASMIRRIASSG